MYRCTTDFLLFLYMLNEQQFYWFGQIQTNKPYSRPYSQPYSDNSPCVLLLGLCRDIVTLASLSIQSVQLL